MDSTQQALGGNSIGVAVASGRGIGSGAGHRSGLNGSSSDNPGAGLGSAAARWGAGATSLVACLLAWQWASASHLNLGLVTFQNVPPPTEVAHAGWTLLQSPQLPGHLKASLARVFSGFLVAALVGILLGLAIGRSRRLESWLMPPLEMLRPIPAVAWIPLAILMFPSSELSMVFITFTGALFPILLNTVHGVENIDPRLVASARSLGGARQHHLGKNGAPSAAQAARRGDQARIDVLDAVDGVEQDRKQRAGEGDEHHR